MTRTIVTNFCQVHELDEKVINLIESYQGLDRGSVFLSVENNITDTGFLGLKEKSIWLLNRDQLSHIGMVFNSADKKFGRPHLLCIYFLQDISSIFVNDQASGDVNCYPDITLTFTNSSETELVFDSLPKLYSFLIPLQQCILKCKNNNI